MSLYVGLLLFAFVVITICVIATIVSSPDDDLASTGQRRRRRFFRRFLRMREEPEVDDIINRFDNTQALPVTVTGNRSSMSSARAAELRDAPPRYDDVVSVRSTTGSEQSLVSTVVVDYPDVTEAAVSPPLITAIVGNGRPMLSRALCDESTSADDQSCSGRQSVELSSSGSTQQSTSGGNLAESGSAISAATANYGNILTSASRRFLHRVSPPNYFQVSL